MVEEILGSRGRIRVIFQVEFRRLGIVFESGRPVNVELEEP